MNNIIFAYEKKLPDGSFIPNGMTEEELIESSKFHDSCLSNQFSAFYLNSLLKYEGIKIKKMLIEDAISSQKRFIIPLEPHAHPYLWLGFESSKGKELFSFFDEHTLQVLRSGQAKVLLHGGSEGCDGVISNQVSIILNLQCMKYKIPETNVYYVTSNLLFEKKYMDHYIESNLRGDPIKVFSVPHFWEVSKMIYSPYKNNPERLPQLSDIDLDKELRFLCYNKVPRGQRYLIAFYLWNKYKELGLLSMSDWDHDLLEFWSSWKEYAEGDIIELEHMEKKFKENLPLSIDCNYEIGDEGSAVTWLMNSWPYKKTCFNIITETSMTSRYQAFLTEKTFKVFANLQPFILAGDHHSLKALQDLGFKTFHPYINELYDSIESKNKRIEALMKEIDRLCTMPFEDLKKIASKLRERVIYNYHHFWNQGSFTRDIVRGMTND